MGFSSPKIAIGVTGRFPVTPMAGVRYLKPSIRLWAARSPAVSGRNILAMRERQMERRTGDNTHHQLQSTTLASLSVRNTMNMGVVIAAKVINRRYMGFSEVE
jgi:hypothetical protein